MRSYATPAIAALLASAFPANAENWTGQLDGLDGVAVVCSSANEEKYAKEICAEMAALITGKFSKADIPAADLGFYFNKTEDEPPTPESLSRPLRVVIEVRGTNSGNIYAINLRNMVSVSYEQAVERGASDGARRGDLVMWDKSTTGSGPRDGLAKAIVIAQFDKFGAELDSLIEAWPR